MRNQEFEWLPEIAGELAVRPEGTKLSNVTALLRYINENSLDIVDDQLEFLGALTYFWALRDYARDARFVLEHTDKALDSFDPGLRDRSKDESFQKGVMSAREYLFEFRSEPYRRIVEIAHLWLRCWASQLK